MKKNEMIYRAIGGISEEKAADAYLYTSEKQKNYRLRTVFSGVGIAAIVCSFFVLSFVLLKVSGPKTDPAATGAEESTVETMLEAETEMETEAETEAATTDKAVETKESKTLVFVENPCLTGLSVDYFRNLEPYSYFIPEEFPENFVCNHLSFRRIAGEYLCEDGLYHRVEELGCISLKDKTINNDYDYSIIKINVAKMDEGYPVTEKLSVSDVKCYISHEAYYSEKLTPGYNYTLEWITEDGWGVNFVYEVYPISDDHLTPQDLFDLATSSPYFKDHPIATGEVKEPNKVGLTGDYDGVELSVEFGSDRYCFTSLVDVTATLKNNTDHDITIVIPVTSEYKPSHREIQVSVFKKGNENICLKDLDTYGQRFAAAESYLTLKPGEEYVQKMRMTGDLNQFKETEQKFPDEIGVYICRATFRLLNGETNTLEFEVPFEG